MFCFMDFLLQISSEQFFVLEIMIIQDPVNSSAISVSIFRFVLQEALVQKMHCVLHAI